MVKLIFSTYTEYAENSDMIGDKTMKRNSRKLNTICSHYKVCSYLAMTASHTYVHVAMYIHMYVRMHVVMYIRTCK